MTNTSKCYGTHRALMTFFTEFSTGFPGYNGRMPLSHGMISKILSPARLVDLLPRQMAAAKFNVLPLDGRSILRQLDPRPSMAEPRSTYTYYQGGGEVGGTVAVNVFNRSHSITAEVVIPEGGAEGVLLAHGGQFAGYSFYLKNNKLRYTHNYVGLREYDLESSSEVPAGQTVLRYEFEVTGPPNFAQGKGAPGTGRLFIDGRKVAEGEIATTTPLSFALSGEGLCCGWDSLSAASSAYNSPFRFTGRIKKVDVTCVKPATEQPPAPPAD